MRGRLESLCAVALLLLVLPSADAGNGRLALVAAIAALAVFAAVMVSAGRISAGQWQIPDGSGPLDEDERRLHGAFRRSSSPDTPGRPRSRAPGAGRRPV